LISTPMCNSSFSFDLELAGAMLKRSVMDIHLSSSGAAQQSVMQLETFGGGMADYVVVDPNEEKDDDEPHAGLQLTINNNQLRPFMLFQSSSELMSLYWSGKAEEKNSAIQGNMVVQDDRRLLVLSSGLPIQLSASGALSYDSSGQASVSLWTKTAETKIDNAGAFVLDTQCKLLASDSDSSSSSPLVHLIESFETKASINSRTDVNFGGEGQMCIQMTQPTIDVTIKRSTMVSSKRARSTSKKQTLPAKTIFLNRIISDLCSAMKR